MQLVAYRENHTWILAQQAIKGADYRCVECGGVVRKRGGVHRRDHFYHIAPTERCYLSGKSMAHLQVQWAIQQALPAGEAELEKRFEKIDRIADIYWESEKIVFEVQCSPISREEVLARNRDYQSMGCEVVWILHDQRYNKRRMTAAEEALSKAPHYFTNIDAGGEGEIYDQISLVRKGMRVSNFSKFFVALGSPSRGGARLERENRISKKLKKGEVYFSGDTRDRFLSGEIDEQKLIDFFEEESAGALEEGILFYLQRFLQSGAGLYRSFFQRVLEKICS